MQLAIIILAIDKKIISITFCQRSPLLSVIQHDVLLLHQKNDFLHLEVNNLDHSLGYSQHVAADNNYYDLLLVAISITSL